MGYENLLSYRAILKALFHNSRSPLFNTQS